jgi:DNA-binding NarL/FixJ family response regulator
MEECYEVYPEDTRQFADQRVGEGILLVDAVMHTLFAESRAMELCQEIKQMPGEEAPGLLPMSLLKLCKEIKEIQKLRNHQKDWEDFKVKRVMKASTGHVFVSGIGLPEGMNSTHATIVLTLDSIGPRARFSLEQASARFLFTQREITVITYLLKAWTNKEIGNVLRISEQTVKEHVKHIMAKTKATTRTGVLRVLSNL